MKAKDLFEILENYVNNKHSSFDRNWNLFILDLKGLVGFDFSKGLDNDFLLTEKQALEEWVKGNVNSINSSDIVKIDLVSDFDYKKNEDLYLFKLSFLREERPVNAKVKPFKTLIIQKFENVFLNLEHKDSSILKWIFELGYISLLFKDVRNCIHVKNEIQMGYEGGDFITIRKKAE